MDNYISAQSLFTTSACLVDSLDKKVLVGLRDGKIFVGVLRSFDQFANLVLQQVTERLQLGNKYAEIPRGLLLIRGENVVVFSEIDEVKELDQNFKKVKINKLVLQHKKNEEIKKQLDKKKQDVLAELGFCVGFLDTDLY